jgi:hypothetical protein
MAISSTYPIFRTGFDKEDFRVYREPTHDKYGETSFSVRDASLMPIYRVSSTRVGFAYRHACSVARGLARLAK